MSTHTMVRIESDSMGEIAVPVAHYWGAQTERSLHHSSRLGVSASKLCGTVVSSEGIARAKSRSGPARRSVVQRCPAVPIALKATARIVRSTSAVGQTIAPLLPPSSIRARAKRDASRGAIDQPIAVEPVAETSGTRG